VGGDRRDVLPDHVGFVTVGYREGGVVLPTNSRDWLVSSERELDQMMQNFVANQKV